ncbi:hypothetical protein ACQ4LE_011129 [Meloidogyne hapla]|uniref:Uncharacterized protein n=1 Tax=Meloidogyne hapla TaxID=6305 RepID=A0A1I8BXL8_MELHA
MVTPTTSPKNSQEEKFKTQLERQISTMTEELNSIEANNQKLKERYEEEYSKLLDDRKQNEILSAKIKTLDDSLGESESRLKGYKNDSEKDDQALEVKVNKFRKASAEHNSHLRRIFTTLQTMKLSDEDHYGDMSKFKQELRQKIDNAKSGYALGAEELKQKKEILANLDSKLAKVDQKEITSEVFYKIYNCHMYL